MTKFKRFFISLLFTGLSMAYTPVIQAYDNQYGGNMSYTPITRTNEQIQNQSYGSKIGQKALNGFVNITTGVLEIPKNVINTTNNSNIFYGLIGGGFKGIVNFAGRIGVGVADLVTFPLPTDPIVHPVYVWNDFYVDTTYGDVMRVDENQEDHSSIQASVVQPVAAPARVAPKAGVVDRSNQYNHQTNRKLDAIFKKEMMK
ncbi:MAG: exosortase system-associated protein, TIGR04073 family [Methylococcaceae bacterium]